MNHLPNGRPRPGVSHPPPFSSTFSSSAGRSCDCRCRCWWCRWWSLYERRRGGGQGSGAPPAQPGFRMRVHRGERMLLATCLCSLFVLVLYFQSITKPEVAAGVNNSPEKSRRSPLQTLYNGDQQLDLEPSAHRSLQDRRELLERTCLSHTKKRLVLSPQDLKHLIVDDKHSLIYCYVPKVACTNWKRVFMVLTGEGRYTDPLAIPANEAHVAGNLRMLSEFSVQEINQRLRHYLKFIFVRDPFERLVSAYRNKFTRSYNTAFHERYGTKIISRYRADPKPESLEKGNDVTFPEFVQYLVDPLTQQEEPFNEHWERVHSLCHPCIIHYDVVGKYETLEPDAKAVLKLAGGDGLVQFPTSGKITRTDGNMAALYFENISPFYQQKLFNLYRMDFLLFNYSTPEYLRTH